MGLGQEGWKDSGFLGSKRGPCFADRLLRASHRGTHVCYSLPAGSAHVQTSGLVLWLSQGRSSVSPITSSPLIVLPPLCTLGSTRAPRTLCRAGRNSSSMVPAVLWMGWQLGHPLDSGTRNS